LPQTPEPDSYFEFNWYHCVSGAAQSGERAAQEMLAAD
jgi:hypothetical protein